MVTETTISPYLYKMYVIMETFCFLSYFLNSNIFYLSLYESNVCLNFQNFKQLYCLLSNCKFSPSGG